MADPFRCAPSHGVWREGRSYRDAVGIPWEFRAWGKNAKEAEKIAREMNLPAYLKKKK